MLCIVYVIAVGILLGAAGVLIERVLPAAAARRWLWCLIMPLSIFLPGYYRSHHAAVVGQVAADELNVGWWGHVTALDPAINRLWLGASVLLALWTCINAGWVSHLVWLARTGRRGSGGTATVEGVPVVITDALGPATAGVLRTRVLLPRWVLALPRAQRQYVVRHEDEHRRSHDGLLLFIASVVVILVPWNVALWWHLRRLSLAIEIDCDRRVVRALGDAHVYGDLLIKVAQAAGRSTRLQPALAGRAGMLEQRLTVLLAPAPLRFAQRVLLPIGVGALLLIVLTMPHPVLSKAHSHVMPARHLASAR